MSTLRSRDLAAFSMKRRKEHKETVLRAQVKQRERGPCNALDGSTSNYLQEVPEKPTPYNFTQTHANIQ